MQFCFKMLIVYIKNILDELVTVWNQKMLIVVLFVKNVASITWKVGGHDNCSVEAVFSCILT